LVSLTALLSTGPVGPSDKIGMLNRDRVIRSCNANGLLLKPDKPPTILDAVFASYWNVADLSVKIELWDTFTALGDGSLIWHYIVAADSKASGFKVYPKDLKGYVGNSNAATISNGYVYDWYAGQNQISISSFNGSSPLTVPTLKLAQPLYNSKNLNSDDEAPTKIDFRYYVIAPLFPNGWSFLGETGKYVTVSKQRVAEIFEGGNGGTTSVDVRITGAIGEQVGLSFVTPQGKVVSVNCVINAQFEALAHCDSGAHASCVCG